MTKCFLFSAKIRELNVVVSLRSLKLLLFCKMKNNWSFFVSMKKKVIPIPLLLKLLETGVLN